MPNLYNTRTGTQILDDSKKKQQRIRNFLKDKGYSGIVIARRENFSWVTTGGNAVLINSTEKSLVCLVFSLDHQYLVAHAMDGQRILDEQIPGQGYELVELKWFESSPIEKAMQIAGSNGAVDISIPGYENIFPQILEFHYPMTNLEFDRLSWLGRKMNKIFLRMGKFLNSGMVEMNIAAYFQFLQSKAGIASDALIAGGDQRFLTYRHPMPSNNRVNKYLMLHSAARKWGLHTPITRLYSFGEPEKKFLASYKAVANIQARVFEMIKPGIRYSEVFNLIKDAYDENGYKNEWQKHYQGGPTGYIIVDAQRLLSDKKICSYTPFEWFSTVPGSKIAELTLLGKDMPELVSNQKPWPQLTVKLEKHQMNMPGVFVIE